MKNEHFLHYFLAICLVVMLIACAVLALPQQSTAPESGEWETAAATTQQTITVTQPLRAEPTQPATTQPTQPKVLRLTQWPETIAVGETAVVSAQGLPNTEYSIEVHYRSGISQAASLQPQFSDENGTVTWTWKVSKNVSPGDYKIVVTGGDENVEVEFSVTE